MHSLDHEVILASNKLLSLKERLESVRVEDFPSETPLKVLNLFFSLVDALKDRLNQYVDILAKGITKEEGDSLSNRIRTVGVSAAKLGQLIRFIEGARAQNIPWGMVEMLETFCESIIPKIKILIRPRWRYGYDYLDLLDEMGKAVFYDPSDTTQRNEKMHSVFDNAPALFVLSFPSIERDNIIYNSGWLHEVGHILDSLLSKKSDSTKNNGASLSLSIAEKVFFNAKKIKELHELVLASQVDDPKKLPRDKKKALIKSKDAKIIKFFAEWLREITADLFSIYLLGLASVFTLRDVGLSLQDIDFCDDKYPRLRVRLRIMLSYLEELGYIDKLQSESSDLVDREIKNKVQSQIEEIRDLINSTETDIEDRLSMIRRDILEEALLESSVKIKEKIKEGLGLEGSYVCTSDGLINEVCKRVKLLKDNITPYVIIKKEEERLGKNNVKNAVSELALILNAGWFYWIAFGDIHGMDEKQRYEYFREYNGVNRLILKALHSSHVQNVYIKKKKEYLSRLAGKEHHTTYQSTGAPTDIINEIQIKDGVLSKKEIMDRMKEDKQPHTERLIITPLLDTESQIGDCSIDIRLGNEFIVTKRTRFPYINPASRDIESKIEQYQSKIYVPIGQALTLHPHQFALGSILEYIAMPSDLCAIVVGRSSWGRLGLIIATATKVDPRFRGVLTLELVNVGDIPIQLYPCISPIGQLIVINTSSPILGMFEGKYKIATGPGFSRIYDDIDWKYFFNNTSLEH